MLDASDRAGAPMAIVINETGARSLFPGESAVGKRVHLAGGWGNKDDLQVALSVEHVRFDLQKMATPRFPEWSTSVN